MTIDKESCRHEVAGQAKRDPARREDCDGPRRSAARALELTIRRVHRLSTGPRNARTHSAKQVAQVGASIERFGFTNPLLIDVHDVIIAGQARLLDRTTADGGKTEPGRLRPILVRQ